MILACGGFQGDAAMMREHFGAGGEAMPLLAPRARFNTGDGIRLAMAQGADAAGDWNGMHAEPVDPRSKNSAPVVLVYPYGIVVDETGRRFFDEGAGLVHETWETFARHLHFALPGRRAYAILDRRLLDVAGLAARHPLGGAAAPGRHARRAGAGDRRRCRQSRRDRRGLQRGLHWRSADLRRHALRRACREPRVAAAEVELGARHRRAAVSRLADDRRHRLHVRRACHQRPRRGAARQGRAIPGLYAAGEITGHFHVTAPNAVSVLRAFVFGRIAGQQAVAYLGTR